MFVSYSFVQGKTYSTNLKDNKVLSKVTPVLVKPISFNLIMAVLSLFVIAYQFQIIGSALLDPAGLVDLAVPAPPAVAPARA